VLPARCDNTGQSWQARAQSSVSSCAPHPGEFRNKATDMDRRDWWYVSVAFPDAWLFEAVSNSSDYSYMSLGCDWCFFL